MVREALVTSVTWAAPPVSFHTSQLSTVPNRISPRRAFSDRDQNILGVSQKEFTQHYPHEGWVEHDAMEIWSSQYATMMEVVAQSGVIPCGHHVGPGAAHVLHHHLPRPDGGGQLHNLQCGHHPEDLPLGDGPVRFHRAEV